MKSRQYHLWTSSAVAAALLMQFNVAAGVRDVLVRATRRVVSEPAAPVPQAAPSLFPAPKYVGQNASGVHGHVERMDPGFDALIAPGTEMELLANGFQWSEGPTWLWRENAVVFSDVPQNTVYRWSEKDGISVFLKPSGYTGSRLSFPEPGSNGLTIGPDGSLVLCQHGDRRISRLTSKGFEPLVKYYDYHKFNSPNDLVFDRLGNLYFTDPPYGLDGGNNSPLKELPWNGVYLRRKSGEIVLLTKEMTFPNGIALSPDERTLYVAQSDDAAPILKAFPITDNGTLGAGRIFYDTTPYRGGRSGVPDGLKVDIHGNVFATGAGGVHVINPEGKLLGILNTGGPTGNCCWGDDGTTLYITADKSLCRIRTLTKGTGRGYR